MERRDEQRRRSPRPRGWLDTPAADPGAADRPCAHALFRAGADARVARDKAGALLGAPPPPTGREAGEAEGGEAPGGELKQTRAEKRRAKQEERQAKREARRAERQGDPPNEQGEPLRPLSEEPWDTSEALTETAMPVVIPDVPAPPAPTPFGDDPAFGEEAPTGDERELREAAEHEGSPGSAQAEQRSRLT